MSIIEQAYSIFSIVPQTDILIFLVSIAVHALVFGRWRLVGRDKGRSKPAKSSTTSKEDSGDVDASAAAGIRRAGSAAAALQTFNATVSDGAVGNETLLAAAASATAFKDAVLAKAVLVALPHRPRKEVAAAVLQLCASDGPLACAGPEATFLHLSSQSFWAADLTQEASQTLATTLAPILFRLFQSIFSEKGIADGFRVVSSRPSQIPGVYTTLVEACLHVQGLEEAQRLLREVAEHSLAEAAAFKAVAKYLLIKGDTQGAISTLKAMRAGGVSPPSSVFFSDLAETTPRGQGGAVRGDLLWALVDEMRRAGLKPNQIICTQAMKWANKAGKAADFEKALELVHDMGEGGMNDLVLGALCDAAITSGCYQHLASQLHKHFKSGKVQAKGCYAIASIIRAYGVLNDVRGVWAVWMEMKRRHVVPASVTLGCMVEAITSNGDPDSGYQVIREQMDDPQTRPIVNAVIYCSVLKGFSHQKRFDRVWELYEEMRAEKMQFSIVTFNTLIDACSRSKDMGRIPQLLEEMTRVNIEPNTITFSAIIKGYCNCPENRLVQAFEVLEQMKRASLVSPDEVTYNTLLDGCARFGQWNRGLQVLKEMEENRIAPSAFTLTVLAKLANRSKRPHEAMGLVEQVASKYRLRLNIHVFNNLVQACAFMEDFGRGLEVFERLLRERVRPDARTYALLLKAAVAGKHAPDAVRLLRAAGGLPGAHAFVAQYKDLVRPKEGLTADVILEVIEGIATTCGSEALAVDVIREIQGVAGLPLDKRRLMKSACAGLLGRA